MSEQEGDLITEKRKTKVVISDELKKELLDRLKEENTKEKREVQALGFLQNLKQQFNEKYNTKEFDDCTSFQDVDNMQQLIEKDLNEKKQEKRPPSGKSSISRVNVNGEMRTKFTKEDLDGGTKMLNDLYHIAYYAKEGEVTVQERAEAKRKIEKLFSSLIDGKAWEQLRSGQGRMPNTYADVTACSHCGTIMDLKTSSVCPSCGYDMFTGKKVKKQ